MTNRQVRHLLIVLAFGFTASGLLWDIREVYAIGTALVVAELTWVLIEWADRRWPRKGSTAHSFRQLRAQSVFSYRYNPEKEQK